jgi:pSer/pThr/pTyr-binding forkhead associated (FHA) protein
VAAGNRFCGACGSQIPEAAAEIPPVAAQKTAAGGNGKKTLFFGTMQASRAKLVLIKGEGYDGESYALAGQDHRIGREVADVIFDEDPFLCPTHANFFYAGGKLMVRDESTANGVYLRIRGSRPLSFGDRFLIGEQVMRVEESVGDKPQSPKADGTYFYSSPRRSANFKLVQTLHGGADGLAHLAQTDVVSIGREGNDINFPDDPFISGHHAQVTLQDGKLALTDLGSKNGTFIQITQEIPLEHGDYVFMGQQLLRVEIV